MSACTGGGINELFENIGMRYLKIKENENVKSSLKLNQKKVVDTNNHKKDNKNKCNYC